MQMDVPSVLRERLLRVQPRAGPEAAGLAGRLEVLDAAGRQIWR